MMALVGMHFETRIKDCIIDSMKIIDENYKLLYKHSKSF